MITLRSNHAGVYEGAVATKVAATFTNVVSAQTERLLWVKQCFRVDDAGAGHQHRPFGAVR
jgi:hypothetical protein